MANFLTTIAIGADNPSAKQALIGAEAAHLRLLNEEGTLPVALLAADAATAWLVLEAGDEDEVRGMVERFPLAPWFDITAIEPVRILQPQPNGP